MQERPRLVWPAEKGALYSVFIVDINIERVLPKGYFHWAVINIPGNRIGDGNEVGGFSHLHKYKPILGDGVCSPLPLQAERGRESGEGPGRVRQPYASTGLQTGGIGQIQDQKFL